MPKSGYTTLTMPEEVVKLLDEWITKHNASGNGIYPSGPNLACHLILTFLKEVGESNPKIDALQEALTRTARKHKP